MYLWLHAFHVDGAANGGYCATVLLCYCARISELEGVDSFFSVRNAELALRLFHVSQLIFMEIILLKINMVHLHCDAV